MGDSAEALIECFREFSCGEILGFQEVPERLTSMDRLCTQIEWLVSNGSDQGFFDVLVAKHDEHPAPVSNAAY